MRLLISKIDKGQVRVDCNTVSSTDRGLAVFVGFQDSDDEETLAKMVDKIINMRIFQDQEGKLNYSLKDHKCGILCVPNFTLCANTAKGRRPSFESSLSFSAAKDMFARFVGLLRKEGTDVQEGIFGVNMSVVLDMNGPVNIILDSRETT